MQQTSNATPRSQIIFSTLLVGAVSILTMFWNLNLDRVRTDEAHYALATENIRVTHDWFHVTPVPPIPYFQKPPLYMWLSALTYDLVPGLEAKFRVWSALFGVGSAVLTCLIGAKLFRAAEVGLLAGLLLAINDRFLMLHGARTGNFDTGITFLLALSVLLYLMIVDGRLGWSAWIGIGIAAGVACLLKPLIGGATLALLAILAMAIDRSIPLRRRVGGLVVALAVCIVVAAPWYVAMYREYGSAFIDGMFRVNLLERATSGVDPRHLKGPLYYFVQISKSSPPFFFFLPAIAYGVFQVVRPSPHRRGWGVILLLVISWVGAFAISRSKYLHYTYPVFPYIAIAIAMLGMEVIRWIGSILKSEHFPSAAYRAVVAVLLFAACYFAFAIVPARSETCAPWAMYQSLRPAIASGRAQVLLYGFPAEFPERRSKMDLESWNDFYLRRIEQDAKPIYLNDPEPLAALLAERRPTFALLAKRVAHQSQLDSLREQGRIDSRFDFQDIPFSIAAIDLASILSPRVSPGNTNDSLELLDPSLSATKANLLIRPAIRTDSWISVTLRIEPAAQPRKLQGAIFLGKRELTKFAFRTDPKTETKSLTARVRKSQWSSDGTNDVTIKLQPADARSNGASKASIVEARLNLYPSVVEAEESAGD